jgi:hypothetical protein
MMPSRQQTGRRTARIPIRKHLIRPQIDAFEKRLTPAVFNIAPGDTAGLIAAVNACNINNEPDTIELAAGSTYTYTLPADSYAGGDAIPQILRDSNSDVNTLTIHGNGATLQRSPVVGTPNFRLFSIGVFPNNVAVSMSNLTLLNGNAGTNEGGAIYQQSGDLTLTGCTFQANQGDTGGAVYVSTTSIPQRTVSITNCSFLGNTATGAGNGGAGGAVYVLGDSSLTIAGSEFAGNSAAREGGAVREQTSSQFVTISNSDLSGNTGASGGGAVFVQGPTTLTNCTINNNNGTQGGGGVWVQAGSTSNLTMTGCTLNGNQATNPSVSGGGVFSQANTNITNCTVANNTVGASGGGIYVQTSSPASLTLSGSTVSANQALSVTGAGGGVFCQSSLTMVDSTINGNRAGNGGGIAFVSGSSTTGSITNSTITDNRSFFALAKGGGIEVTGTGVLSLGETIVAGNAFDATVSSGTGPDIGGPVVSLGYDLIQNMSGATVTGNTTGNIVGQSPNLGSLQSNGGPTPTRVPNSGSLVIDAGDPAFAPPPSIDQRGGPRVVNGRIDIGAVEVVTPVTVATATVNGGAAERSDFRSLTVTFSGPVTFAGGDANAAAAFQLKHIQTGNNVGLSATVSTTGGGQTQVKLTFFGSETDAFSIQGNANAVDGPSLADGRYQLTINGSAITDASGFALDGDGDGLPGGNYVSPADTFGGNGPKLYRLFGDADGNGVVDSTDLGQVRATFNANNSQANYLQYLDANNDGVFDSTDLGQFRVRFNANVF